jgi:hypothetical protein
MVEIGAGNDVSGRFMVLKLGPIDVMDKAKAATPTSSYLLESLKARQGVQRGF